MNLDKKEILAVSTRELTLYYIFRFFYTFFNLNYLTSVERAIHYNRESSYTNLLCRKLMTDLRICQKYFLLRYHFQNTNFESTSAYVGTIFTLFRVKLNIYVNQMILVIFKKYTMSDN